MKKIIALLIILMGLFPAIKAQNKPVPTGIPPFKILRTDSTYMTPADLKKHKPLIIVYFSPDCTHCQAFTEELKRHMDKEKPGEGFRNAQIVMVTFAMLQAIQIFYKDYELAKYPNVIVGTEGYTYVVQKFYQVTTTPYMAVYGKNGVLIQGFEKAPKFDDLLAALKKA